MDKLKKAIENLSMIRLIKLSDREIRLAILLDKNDWRNLSAPWWRGKSAFIDGVELNGNFLLCKASGAFILWDNLASIEVQVSNNLDDLLSKLELDLSNVP